MCVTEYFIHTTRVILTCEINYIVNQRRAEKKGDGVFTRMAKLRVKSIHPPRWPPLLHTILAKDLHSAKTANGIDKLKSYTPIKSKWMLKLSGAHVISASSKQNPVHALHWFEPNASNSN